ncbi:conserved hypothetical protein [Spirosoma linguale DSM 74]|uniref:Transmembrane protein n=1 Tax=Spirosoma linguale (strain ATCC 33905 / DSM 74 / LMG 10896 / Claus 1) TaxID=504472 RepID=D2QC42_SPILD|nr:conserved hypothetical protein [Spirosoma linguale DSM 74]
MSLAVVKALIAFASVSLSVGGWYFDAIKQPPTHLFNPDWLPHARYHSALWLFSVSLSSLGSLWLLWGSFEGRDSELAIRMAAFLPALFYLSFFPSLLFRNTSAWDDGEKPFLFTAPQVLISTLMLLLLGASLWMDKQLRTH